MLTIISTGIATLLFATTAYADATPAVTSLSVDPTSISNDHTVLISWAVNTTNGVSIYFDCPLGVSIATDSGSSVSCNTRVPILATTLSPLTYKVTNVSGSTQTVGVRLYPHDSSGNDYDAGAANTSFTVTSITQPITGFSVSPSIVTSGSPVTLTWTGVDVPGTMLQFGCIDNLQIYPSAPAASTVPLPCDANAYTSDLAQSGSVSVVPKLAPGADQAGVTVRIFPSIIPGTYNGIASRTIAFGVRSIPVASTTLSVQSFNGQSSTIAPETPFTLSWATTNTAGVNLQFQCNSAFNVTLVDSTTTLPCNAPVFTTALAGTGSTTITLHGSDILSQGLTVTLLPQASDGSYLGALSRTLYIPVIATATIPIVPLATTPMNTTTTTSAASSSVSAVQPHAPFTIPMRRGSRGAQVTALQQFLSLNADIYPDALATGYFGTLTVRAVQRFQDKYDIAHSGDEGYGLVGPLTRAKLNILATP